MTIRSIILVLLALLASSVTGDVTGSSDHHQLKNRVNVSSWDLLESLANDISSRIDMTFMRFRDMPIHSLWLSYAASSRSNRPTAVKNINEMLTNKQYVKSRIQMVGTILLGPEKSWSTLYSIRPREPYYVDAKLHQCYHSSIALFDKHCGFPGQSKYKHMLPFENLCAHVSDRTKIEEAIIVSCGSKKVNAHVVNLSNPRLEITPTPLDGSAEYCERIAVNGVSRLNFGSFAKVYRVSLEATRNSRYSWYKRTQVCFHWSPSLGLCHCGKNDWRSFEHAGWSFVMSPYRQGILDIKFNNTIDGDSVSISIEEVLQPWRYVLLVVGFALFFVAPAVEMYILSMVVDDVKAHSISWMIRVIALSCIFQSSKDTQFALALVVCCLVIYSIRSIIKDPSKIKELKFWHRRVVKIFQSSKVLDCKVD